MQQARENGGNFLVNELKYNLCGSQEVDSVWILIMQFYINELCCSVYYECIFHEDNDCMYYYTQFVIGLIRVFTTQLFAVILIKAIVNFY